MTPSADPPVVYWHRELPPLGADPADSHTITAASARVPGTIAYRDELWRRCYDDLMTRATGRLEQELARMKGDYAHVYDESIETRHDASTGEAWLSGRFDYVLYRRPAISTR